MAGFIPPHLQQQFLQVSGDFFTWWLSELRDFLPLKWRHSLSGQKTLYRLVAEQNHITVVHEAEGNSLVLGKMDLTPVLPAFEVPTLLTLSATPATITRDNRAAFQQASQALSKRIGECDSEALGRVELELSDDYLLVRDISFPLLIEGDIESVLQYEIDRLTPFQKDNVCYGYDIIERNQDAGKLKLRLACLERAVLENIFEQCQTLGLRLTSVKPGSELVRQPRLSKTMDLLPADKRPVKERLWNRSNQLTAALSLLLLLVVLMLPLWHYQQEINALSRDVDALIDKSKVVRVKQARLMTALDIREALVERKDKEYEKLAIVHHLTRLIPDNTWLNRLTIRQLVVDIEGESDKSSDLIEKLESHEAFQQVAFSSSVTSNSRTGKERFQVKMQLSEKPLLGRSPGAATEDAMGDNRIEGNQARERQPADRE